MLVHIFIIHVDMYIVNICNYIANTSFTIVKRILSINSNKFPKKNLITYRLNNIQQKLLIQIV